MEISHSPFTVLINSDLTVNEILVDGTSLGCEVGAIFRFARVKGLKSIDSIAAEVEKSMNFIYQIERNERKASPTLLRALCSAYGISTHYPLLALLDNILTVDEYIAIINSSSSDTLNNSQPLDLNFFLNDANTSVLYEGHKLNLKQKYMLQGALELIILRRNEQCTKLSPSNEK